MKYTNYSPSCILFIFVLISAVLLPACDREVDHSSEKMVTKNPDPPAKVEQAPTDNIRIDSENSRYLFDVTDHALDELQALLQRAEEITQTRQPGYEDIKIALILHGPDINLFTQQNYAQNKHLVDLAAKLDAFDIIDMKICETTMSSMGVSRSDIPPFIESVPYAPDEIKRLLNEENYISL